MQGIRDIGGGMILPHPGCFAAPSGQRQGGHQEELRSTYGGIAL
jgi:hypothetical protein